MDTALTVVCREGEVDDARRYECTRDSAYGRRRVRGGALGESEMIEPRSQRLPDAPISVYSGSRSSSR
jgi:hypothetical protein